MLHSFIFWNVFLDTFLLTIEANLLGPSTNITIIGVCHFSGTIHNTAHNTYLQALHTFGGFLDLSNSGAKIVKRSATTGTRNILGLDHTEPASLQNTKGSLLHIVLRKVAIVHKPNTIH